MIKLIHGDCLEEMDKLIEQGIKVDAIITDPPYGTTKCKWDSVIPFNEMWLRLNKLIKPNGAIVLAASQPFTTTLIYSNIKMFKYCWVWDKNRGNGHLVAKYRPMQRTEDVCIFGQGRINYYPQMVKREKIRKNTKEGGKRTDIMGGNKNIEYKFSASTHRHPTNYILCPHSPTKTLHPTQKPVALMEYLIKTYTNKEETVLDFTMGSGTTMVAAQNLNRNGIGIELNDKYFEIAKNRIEYDGI